MTSNQHHFSVPQCSLWKCQMSPFHLGEILSDLLSSSSSAEGPVCTGPCFIWISKPVRRWSNILNSILGALFKECDYLRVIDEGIWSLNNADSVQAGWWPALSDSWRPDEHSSAFASHCAFLLGCSVQMAFEKLFTFLALNPNNVEHAPDTSEAYSCLLSCIHSINERHTRVTVGVWHLLAQCLGICYKTYLSCLSHLCLSVQLLLPFKWASISQRGIKS